MSTVMRVYPNKPAIREEIERTLLQAFFYAKHHDEAEIWRVTPAKSTMQPIRLSFPSQVDGSYTPQLGSFTPSRYFNLECASVFCQIVFNFGVVVYFEEAGDAGDRLECALRTLVNFAECGESAKGSVSRCRAIGRGRICVAATSVSLRE